MSSTPRHAFKFTTIMCLFSVTLFCIRLIRNRRLFYNFIKPSTTFPIEYCKKNQKKKREDITLWFFQMYAMAWHTNLFSRLGDLEVLILLVSCICHDLDHPGYNNIYQINARTELALRFVFSFSFFILREKKIRKIMVT